MGEPARKYDPSIEPDIRPELGLIQGGGESTPERGNLSAMPNSNLSNREQIAGKQSTKNARHLRSVDPNEGVKNDEASRNNAQWSTNTENMGAQPKTKVSWWRKKSASILITLGLAGGGLGVGFISGPATMLVNLMENLTINNDSSSVTMERRFLKVFGKAVGDPICQSTTKNLKCKFGRISNKALRKLEKKGFKANFDSDTRGVGNRLGYPSKNPTSYTIDIGNGTTVDVQAKELRRFLAQPENRAIASKVLGTGGAFNVRLSAWWGKHMKLKFWNPLKISPDGGHADGKNANLTEEERREKLKSKIPDSKEMTSVADRISSKMTGRLNKAKKGGTTYMAAAATCIAMKAPRYVAGGVAAIQLAQIASMGSDTILSPGSKLKANAVEKNFTSDDMNFIGTTLTERTKNSEGKMTSVTDSGLFKQALGIEKNKTPTNMEFAPGGSIFGDSAVMGAVEVEKESEAGCDAVLSTEAMYAAAATDATVTVIASATIVGGIVKVVGSWAVSKVVGKIVTTLIEGQVPKLLEKLAKNDKIPNARGEELGDILGLGAMGFFSAGGMAHHLPTLKTSQLASYDKVRQDSENFQREMDIASLSPFDTSSRHTFLGSMIFNTQTAMIANSAFSGRISSMFSSLATIPALTLSPAASADTGFSQQYCGYAEDFGMAPEAAINASGTPCTGLTGEQVNMSTDKAIDAMINEGWIATDKEVEDGDTIGDLVENGVIKEDTPLYDYIDECSNPASGDYLFNADSCTVDCSSNCTASGTADQKSVCIDQKDSEGKTTKDCGESEGVKREVSLKDPSSVAAIPVFLVDYQILQSMNGEDDASVDGGNSGDTENASEDITSGSNDDIAWPMDEKYYKNDKSDWLGPHTPHTGTAWGGDNMGTSGKGTDLAADIGNPPDGTRVFSMFNGTVTSTNLCGSNDGIAIKSSVNGKTLGVAYMHGTDKQFKVGDSVKAGDYIMKLGAIGCNVTGGHVHIGVAYDGKYICPQDIFLALEKDTMPDFNALIKKAIAPCARSI